MIASARSMYIVQRLNETGVVDYKSAASEMGVSEATVRRDFEKLEKQGALRRVQCGAVRVNNGNEEFGMEPSIPVKDNRNTRVQFLVARAAAEVVQPGEYIYLDMGASVAPLASLLLSRPICIVTCSNAVLKRVTPESRAGVFVVGGRLMPSGHAIVGTLAEHDLEQFAFHRAFIGCMGLDVKGNIVYEADMECMRLKRIAMKNAASSYLLADQSKLNKVGLFRFSGIDAFDSVFLDGPRPGQEPFPDNVVFAEE